MKAWYLAHSGFAVETESQLLVFDYYLDTPAQGGLEAGVVAPEDFADKRITVFSSHRHQDHFNRCILPWRQRHADLVCLLSSDIAEQGQGILSIAPGQTVRVREDLEVRAFESNDEGVAFLVKTPDRVIYHAGDLNWWHWNGEPDEYNRRMGERYRGQIELLRGEKIDLAFLPADPRLEDKYALGLDYFMRTVGARRCVPMHLWERYEVCGQLRSEGCTAPYRDALVSYSRRGERVE